MSIQNDLHELFLELGGRSSCLVCNTKSVHDWRFYDAKENKFYVIGCTECQDTKEVLDELE